MVFQLEVENAKGFFHSCVGNRGQGAEFFAAVMPSAYPIHQTVHDFRLHWCTALAANQLSAHIIAYGMLAIRLAPGASQFLSCVKQLLTYDGGVRISTRYIGSSPAFFTCFAGSVFVA